MTREKKIKLKAPGGEINSQIRNKTNMLINCRDVKLFVRDKNCP